MKKLLLLAVAGLFCTPVHAANFSAKDAAAATIVFTNPGNCTTGCTPIFAWSDSTGANLVAVITAGADAASNTANGGIVYNRNMVFNGTTWDRWQGGISIASGKVASGAFASGSIASGAVASGAVSSGAYVAGSLAAGACVDGCDLTQGAIADAAVTAGATGSVSAKLRSISRDVGTVATNTTGAATAANQATEIASLATIATNTGAAIPAGTARIGYVSDDPCTQLTKTNLAIATSSGTVQVVAPSGSTQVYVCSFSLIAAAAAVVNLVGGTGASCTTGTPVAALGSTTAASGASLAANGGLTFGNGGATALRTTTAGHGLCLIQSGTTALAGNITFVQQ